MRKSCCVVLLLLGFSIQSFSQERVTTFGIQLKPIIPLGFLDTGKQEESKNNVDFSLTPNLGLNFGMVIRRGITKSVSLESGINFLSRNYDLTISDIDSNFVGTSSFKLVNYEIPVLALIYVQLGNQLFMNVAGGVSLDIYPSDISTRDDYFLNELVRLEWLRASLITNIGWEYRTDKSGYFYLGMSLHRPFGKMFNDYVNYDAYGKQEGILFKLSGNYFTVDFRYFFHEDKEKKKKKLKKEPKRKKFIDPRK